MTDQEQKLVQPAEQAEKIIIMPHHDLTDNCCHLVCLGTFDLHQSRLNRSDANRVLAPPSLVMIHMQPGYRSNTVLT